ncbi:hypothetical protein NX059_010947 [Plenodomus lindquistii]|nr:hypothetical protein NX059_010947 [Plenodomus lindquistii]
MEHIQYGQPGQPQPQMNSHQHNRFSWQIPLQEDPQTHNEPQQHMPQQPQQQPQQPQQQQPSTDVSSRHFSYAQTPAEHRAFVYTSSQNDPPLPQQARISVAASLFTPIDPRPQSMLDPNFVAPPVPQMAYVPPSYSQDEKSPVSLPAHHDHNTQQYRQQQHPAQQMVMPQTAHDPQLDTQQSRHARQMSNLSPINTNLTVRPMPPIPPTPPSGTQTSPMPYKNPITPISAGSTKRGLTQDGPTSPSSQKSYAHEPYSPHGFPSSQTNNFHAVFSPDAAHGPNGLDFALHQPGQIAHPNMESETSHEWTSGLCSCSPDISTCLTGLFCPCILYGRTSYRLSQKSAKKDPTDMLGHSSTNAHCMLMSLSCGLWGLFPGLQRTRIRHAYKLKGSLVGDLLKGCCCCCCVSVQNEREVKSREEASRRWAGPASTDVYTRTGGMVYKPQMQNQPPV